VFDGIRGLLLPLVVFYHARLVSFFSGGPIVIDFFFVLSGFLICSLLIDEQNRAGSIGLRNFYTRRVLRLLPAMYAMLAVFSLFSILALALKLDTNESLTYWWVDVLGSGLYVYNFVAAAFPDTVTGAIGHTWSLTVEEQFYFIYPLILVAVLKKRSARSDRRLVIGSLIFVAVFIAVRFKFQYIVEFDGSNAHYIDIDDPTWQGFLYRFASTRPDMIVYGCLCALVARQIPRPIPAAFRKGLAVLAGIGWIVFWSVMFLGNTDVPGFTLWGGPAYQIGLIFLGIMSLDLYFRQESWYARGMTWAPLRWLGLRTYGIYLWHVLPLWFLLPVISQSYGMKRLVIGAIASGLGILCGLASYQFLERRFLHLKDRFSSNGAAPKQKLKAATADGTTIDLTTPTPAEPAPSGDER